MKKVIRRIASQLVLAATFALMLLPALPNLALALTSARTQTANLSSAAAGNAIILRNGEQLSYTVLSGNDPNVSTVVLEKSCDGANFQGLSVAVSTANNIHASTFSGGPIPVEGCAGGKVYYRFRVSAYTSGVSSTTITEADNIVNSLYNNSSESVLDVLDGGLQANGYLKTTGLTTISSATVTGIFKLAIRTKAQLAVITPAVGDEYSCSDCTDTYSILVGTGATVAGFREVGLLTGIR